MAKTAKADKIIDLAVKRLKLADTADGHNRTAGIDDLRFANGDQWDSREKKRRADDSRPALTLNFLPKFIDQVVGDMLHNSPSVKIRPLNSQSDIAIAKIRQGIISNIEYQSNAKGIYSYASKQMVTSGFGGWRVLTRYTEENPFMQEIYLEGVRNPFLMYLDPSAKDQNYSDAEWGFILEKMTRDDFVEKYPNAVAPSENLVTTRGIADELWYDKDTVTVAEYFCKEHETVEILQLEDGRVVDEEEYKIIKEEWKSKQDKVIDAISTFQPQPVNTGTPPPGSAPVGVSSPGSPQGAFSPQTAPPPGLPPQGAPPSPPMPPPQVPPPNPLPKQIMELGEEPKIAKRRNTKKTVIRHRIITNIEIIDGGVEGHIFPGKYIPLVLVRGKELNIEGKNYVYSLVRHAKDPQKLINYWNTAAAETIALAPKSPWLGTPKQFEGFEGDYAKANVSNMPFLQYNVDPEAPGAPQRQQPGQAPLAIFEQIRRGEDNLKSVIGLFNADVGGPTSQQTGAAVNAVQRPGDVSTFEFNESMARAVLYSGKIINEMIPAIYDTERDVRIRNFDDSESFVPVNTTVESALKAMTKAPHNYPSMDIKKLHSIFAKDGKDAKYNDVTAGQYDVVVTTGPSYSTQRQESAQHLLQLVQSMPQQMGLAADLIVQNLDFKDADELANRIRKTLPPHLIKPRAGEPPPQPLPPTPQIMLAQSKVALEQEKIKLQQMKVEHEKVRLQKEMSPQAPEQEQRHPVEDQLATMRVQLEQFKLQLEKERLDNERNKQELTLQLQREMHQAKLEEMRVRLQSDLIKQPEKGVSHGN